MTFDKDLEKLIGNARGRGQTAERIAKNINIELYVDGLQTHGVDNLPMLTEEEQKYHRALQLAENTTTEITNYIESKDEKGKTGYEKLVKPVLAELSDEGKREYYINIITKGARPDNPSKELKEVALHLDLAEKLRTYVEKGDGAKVEIILNSLGIDATALLGTDGVHLSYVRARSPGMYVEIGKKIVEAQRALAHKMLKEKPELQKEVEKVILEKKEYGLAASELHKVYTSKHEQEYRTDLAEAKKKTISLEEYRKRKEKASA